jgi:GNAT superfamily N-acetyltransferase
VRGDVIRAVGQPDVAAVADLVHELAEYERAPLRHRLTRSRLRRALFGAEPALFGHLAEVRGTVVGCALWRLDFCAGDGSCGIDGGPAVDGPGIYLQDLYVQPAHRGRGLGRGLLAALAVEACQRGLVRLEWSVQEWNVLAQGFYRGVGGRPDGARSAWKMGPDALTALAARSTAG